MAGPPYVPKKFADTANQRSPRVTLFESGHDGYGDAQRANLQYIFPRRNRRPYSYNRVYGNAELRWQGEIGAGVAVSSIAPATSGAAAPPVFISQWEDAVPNPLTLIVSVFTADGTIDTLQGGVAVNSASLGAKPTGATLHDDGAGIPYLYVAFGAPSGGTTKLKKRDRAGTITTVTNLIADKLLSLNNDLYVTATPTGGTAICGVGKVSAGTNPSTAAQPSLTMVGWPGTSINNIVASGDGRIPVTLKPEGIFTYDRALDLWRNQAPGLKLNPHPDNGKVYWYEDGDLCVGLGSGGAVRFNGSNTVPYDPIPLFGQPNNDTTPQLIGAAGNTRHWGALVTQIGAKRQRTGGVGSNPAVIDVGKTADGTTYTDYSTEASDGSDTTFIVLSGLGPRTANNWMVVGSPTPFSGIYFDIKDKNAAFTQVGGQGLAIDVWTGAAWVSAGVTGSYDMTSVTPTAAATDAVAFARSGWVMMTTDPVALGWVKNTLTVGSAKSRYWARISYDTYVGPLTTPTQVKGLELLPYRPSIDATNFPRDGLDRASAFPHLLFSFTSADGEHVTHDYGTLAVNNGFDTIDEIGVVAYSHVGGIGKNDNRSLILAGVNRYYMVELALDDRPALASWPILAPKGLVELPTVDLDTPVSISDFTIEGVEWNATGFLYYRWEDGKPWTRAGSFTSLPYTIPMTTENAGRYLKVAVGWTLSAAQQRQVGRPRITRIDCLPVPSDQKRGMLPVANPPVV